MRKLFTLLMLGVVATALSACCDCGHCIKDPPCKCKPACAPVPASGCAK